tara:strand:+ start:1206 stop:1670 length:465 start_codon:yes stop_codon:yes gene_type:complete
VLDNIDEIYNAIARNILNAIPEEWDEAALEILMFTVDYSIGINGFYTLNGEKFYFDILRSDFESNEVRTSIVFYELFKRMQENESDVPWNKCIFELNSDGSFKIKFKLDMDFEWYKSLDPDSDEFYALDISVVEAIQTWEGLPDGVARSWKAPK